MKKIVVLFLTLMVTRSIVAFDAEMYQWKSHFAYGSMLRVVEAKNCVFGLAGGAMFSVDKSAEEITTYSKQNGLNGGDIAQIEYDPNTSTLIVAYADGLIDFYKGNQFIAMTDLQQKSITASKSTNAIVVKDGIAYFCMPFGIMVVDVQRRQIKDTYYVGENGGEVNILGITFSNDSIFAISANTLFSIGNEDNKMDYQNWHRTGSLPTDSCYQSIAYWNDELFVVAKSTLAQRKDNTWHIPHPELQCNGLRLNNDKLFLLTNINGIFSLTQDIAIDTVASPYVALDIANRSNTFWIATSDDGIVQQTENETQSFLVNSPLVNIPYRLKIVNDKLYMLAGQRWADENPRRDAYIMIYDIQTEQWSNIHPWKVSKVTGVNIFDLMNVAVDPYDPDHFFVTTYGTGIIECQGLDVVHHYHSKNSPLESAAATTIYYADYVRTDGAVFDANGNLWFLNAGVENGLHIATLKQLKDVQQEIGSWYKTPILYQGSAIVMHTPGELFIDNRYANYKWIPLVRSNTGLILIDDNNTPLNNGDDKVMYRNVFVDQDGKEVRVNTIYSIAQDKEGTLWIGLDMGIITIPQDVNYLTSNRCERIKIARNDGTGLADYLLETESVKAIAIDGANRKWLGTSSSGLYLMSEDGQTTLKHFTEDNSPLISNEIVSLAIDPKTGRLFVGTSRGLMSYQSDAAMPFEDYSSVYAYPNPVRPDFSGVITITGLKDESIVHITDNAGNLVCQTRSLGGTAIWDGKTADGRRAASGVYTVFLNENNDGKHAVTKILVMH